MGGSKRERAECVTFFFTLKGYYLSSFRLLIVAVHYLRKGGKKSHMHKALGSFS